MAEQSTYTATTSPNGQVSTQEISESLFGLIEEFNKKVPWLKQSFAPQITLIDGATPALDAAQGASFYLTAAGDRTIAVPTNPTVGQVIIIVHFASGGARTLALNTGTNGFRFGSDITALSATASGKIDYITCRWNSIDSKWDVIEYRKGY
ncbi:MAG: hypothetical protein NUV80_04430 [Candidatus Berkelbacteria bacterium]|nr:hypothetical protein [Candidatus Berkelbacteria bacterium]